MRLQSLSYIALLFYLLLNTRPEGENYLSLLILNLYFFFFRYSSFSIILFCILKDKFLNRPISFKFSIFYRPISDLQLAYFISIFPLFHFNFLPSTCAYFILISDLLPAPISFKFLTFYLPISFQFLTFYQPISFQFSLYFISISDLLPASISF